MKPNRLFVFGMQWKIILLVVAAGYFQSSEAQDGKVSGLDLPANRQPMYLVPGTLEFWPHNSEGYLNFKHQDSIDLFCATGFRIPLDTEKILTATYSKLTSLFKIGSSNYRLEDIMCNENPKFEARQQGACGNQYKLVSIGYVVAGRGFKSIYDVCFDYTNMGTKYSKYTLLPGALHKSKISGWQADFKDLSSFDSYQFKPHYTQAQELTINKASITKGHLAARADFFYGVEQIATYTFPNAAPQWSKFNAGNWEDLERVIRSNQHERTFDSYTGVLGVMPYHNKRAGIERDALYLDDPNKRIPVPILFFRVVYEPSTQKGVVFVGVNNVFVKPVPSEYIVCNPVTDKLEGIILNNIDNLNRGYLYACEFNEFQQKYPYLPKLPVTSLLFKEKVIYG